MGTAREVGAGGLENCDQADRAEQGKGLLYGILVLRRVLDAEGQGTSHVHGRGEGKALLLLNERIGRGSAGLTTGVGLLSSRALASAAYTCLMMPAASSPEMSGVRQAANFDRGSAKPCCSA